MICRVVQRFKYYNFVFFVLAIERRSNQHFQNEHNDQFSSSKMNSEMKCEKRSRGAIDAKITLAFIHMTK